MAYEIKVLRPRSMFHCFTLKKNFYYFYLKGKEAQPFYREVHHSYLEERILSVSTYKR